MDIVINSQIYDNFILYNDNNIVIYDYNSIKNIKKYVY